VQTILRRHRHGQKPQTHRRYNDAAAHEQLLHRYATTIESLILVIARNDDVAINLHAAVEPLGLGVGEDWRQLNAGVECRSAAVRTRNDGDFAADRDLWRVSEPALVRSEGGAPLVS
jgi:hypothetical protein